MTIVDDSRAVDPVAYIRALGLRPEDSIGFLPLDVHSEASFLFLYRDRPDYARARAQLPVASAIREIDLGVVAFGVGKGRQIDVTVPAEGCGGGLGDLLAQAQALQQSYQGMPGMPDTSPAAQEQRLAALRDSGALSPAEHDQALYGLRGGHAGPAPAQAASDAPALVVHRLYPKLYERSTREQFDTFLPRYRDLLGLCSEDVYGVWPRSTRTADTDGDSIEAWDDYWILYRDRPEYAAGRAAWAEAMNEPGGLAERMFSSLMQGVWPEPELVPGVAGPSAAPLAGRVTVQGAGWPRKMMVKRKRGAELGEALRDLIRYEPEHSFGLCPDFNSHDIYFARRTA